MNSDNHLSAAILASAAFNKTTYPEGTNTELELRKLYRRFLSLTLKPDKESADTNREAPANAH